MVTTIQAEVKDTFKFSDTLSLVVTVTIAKNAPSEVVLKIVIFKCSILIN